MKIIFVKQYIDPDTYDQVVIISEGTEAELLDDVTGTIEISEGMAKGSTIRLTGVPATSYVEQDLD